MTRIALATLAKKMEFVGETHSNHEVRMDAGEAVGGTDKAARPAELPFVGLAGCTGMDVISILRKMRQEFATFKVEVEGLEKREEYPKHWTEIRVVFTVTGELDVKKVTKAIDLSRTRYCGVSAILREAITIHYRLVLNGEVHDLPDEAQSEDE